MKNMTIKIENISGLSFGARMVDQETLDEYREDGVLGDSPFEITDSTVVGPLLSYSKQIKCMNHTDKEIIEHPVAGIPSFTTNKEIDESGLFSKEQAAFVKNTLKWAVNSYYKAWRAGQVSGAEQLLEVEERGDGGMYSSIQFDGPFNKDNLFFILGDTLPHKETVIAAIGYINPDGSIFEGRWEYDDYSYYNPTVTCDGEFIC